ncbi:ThiF family adenylyltransferase (plasmid) [Agrobacterium leguminum]|nr:MULTISPECIES: ThiF family adenylyltransferase [Agrobacterium]WFS69842.1 ThiF family adenylyltransferase [Agrobacterium leguminum]
MWQPENSIEIERSALKSPLARSLAAHIFGASSEFATLRECRLMDKMGVEIVSFEIQVDLPQRPVYPINPVETISVCFFRESDHAPAVLVARPDFPDTPHQNLVPSGHPCALCIDDRPWVDIRSGYTASELMLRIQTWFAKASQGELHGDDQPFDPFFAYAGGHQIIVSADGERAMNDRTPLNVIASDSRLRFLIVGAANQARQRSVQLQVHILHVDVEPQAMRRIRFAPRTLLELSEMLVERGVDFSTLLQTSILDWHAVGKNDSEDRWIFCILLRMPQVHPHTGAVGATMPMAFICEASPGEIGVRMGVLDRNTSGSARGIQFVRRLSTTLNLMGLDLPVYYAPVHYELDAQRGTTIAGKTTVDKRHMVMIGAGSLGSSVSETLAREGLFSWTIVDDDDFLPHNVARHTLTSADLGHGKAEKLAKRLRLIRPDTDSAFIQENVLRVPRCGELEQALAHGELLFDASASVPVSRFLADHPSPARRVCAFFTPNGKSAVLMIESSDRSTNLRDLEACYLHAIAGNPVFTDHLGAPRQLRYTGACRALTNRIPASSLAILTGLIAHGISTNIMASEPVVKIWTIDDRGSVSCVDPEAQVECHSVDSWTILLPRLLSLELRQRRALALPNETGGPLTGIIDYNAKTIAITHALPAPVDSVGLPTSFVRGTRRLRQAIEQAQARTGGQTRYIGEWHSHPLGASASPSGTDLKQIADLSMILNLDGMPALSLILAENETSILIGEMR